MTEVMKIFFYIQIALGMSCSKVWVQSTSLTPSFFIEVPVPCQRGQRPCIYVLGVSIMTLFLNDFAIGFWNCSDSVIFYFILILVPWWS